MWYWFLLFYFVLYRKSPIPVSYVYESENSNEKSIIVCGFGEVLGGYYFPENNAS